MGLHETTQRTSISLKVKAITYISLLILVVGALLSWYFLGQNKAVFTAELRKRALSLTQNLAYNSKYGVLTEDKVILQGLIEGILHENDVLFVLITDAQGKVLAQDIKAGSQATAGQLPVALVLEHVSQLAPHVTAPSIHYHVIGGQGLYHTAAPVDTTKTTPRSLEKQVATALLLLGKEDTSESQTTPQAIRHGSVQLVLSADALHTNVRQAFATGVELTFGIILVGVLISFVFFSYTLTPIEAMASAAYKIAAGDLTQRVAVKSRDEIGVLAMTFNHMTESLDHMTRAQRQRLAELSALHAIGLVISSTLEVDRLITLVLHAIVTHLGYERATLFLVDAEKHALVHGSITGDSAELQARVRDLAIPLRQENGFHARVALSGEPVCVEDLETVHDQGYRPLADILETRALVVVPLKVEDRILGVLSVDNVRTDRAFTAADQDVLTTLANQMAIAIAHAVSYRQIEQLNIGLEEKVQERTEALRRQQAQLQEVNLQLEIANRHKSQFLANMSHELRTPLNAVIGFSEVLLEKMFGEINAKQEEYLNDILGSGEYLLSLINDILDLAKIEAGKLELELSVVHLRRLLEGSLVMIKERALAHNISLKLEVADEIETITGDERKIKQIVFNLLSNAVKFTPARGQVGITATQTGTAVQIAVWDTGVGIAPEDQQRIFDEFQQVGQNHAGKTEGTGLGLTLTKKFVELHGGTLWVESRLEHGSTFTFTLPLAADADHTAADVDHTAVATVQPAAQPEPPAVAASSTASLVLIVEDDPKSADLLRIYLHEAGYAVEVARNGAEGLEKVKHLAPEAIILDVLLPQVDGWAFLTQVKADPATRDVPVIVVSIMDQKGKGFALGAAEYLIKPVHREEFVHMVRSVLQHTLGSRR